MDVLESLIKEQRERLKTLESAYGRGMFPKHEAYINGLVTALNLIQRQEGRQAA